ncbi:hypothetical protein [Prevotella melaninogenica]|uniref:hypothetical protein n=1 Tax=Prevotella melaninogenica TaxID=28132 RepID=UPI0018CCA89C|nr:hypothetical protein [Prevotella melaninogenica]
MDHPTFGVITLIGHEKQDNPDEDASCVLLRQLKRIIVHPCSFVSSTDGQDVS